MPQTLPTSYGWKQPTPFSSLKENQNLTVFDRLVFYAIWENVRNSDGSYDFRHGNKLYQNIEVKRGEIWLVNLDPTIGHEIKKSRPAVIIQNDIGNKYSPITIIAPITSQNTEKIYPQSRFF